MDPIVIINTIGNISTISGVSIRDLFRKSSKKADTATIVSLITYMEGKNVLTAPMEQEVQAAVIKSLESIKNEFERSRTTINDEAIKTILLKLILTLSEELNKLYNHDMATSSGQYKMYLSLQRVRFQISRALAMFCTAFGIQPSQSHPHLAEFILNFAVRPRS